MLPAELLPYVQHTKQSDFTLILFSSIKNRELDEQCFPQWKTQTLPVYQVTIISS
jgi:hypothetical protein